MATTKVCGVPDDELLPRREVARMFGVSEWTVYRNEAAWGLTPDHSDRFVRYPRAEVDAAIKEGVKRRRPGKPSSSGTLRIPVTRTFSPELLHALESITDDQSNFIEQWMWQHPHLKSAIRKSAWNLFPISYINNGTGYVESQFERET